VKIFEGVEAVIVVKNSGEAAVGAPYNTKLTKPMPGGKVPGI
jgi:hypothetical protein